MLQLVLTLLVAVPPRPPPPPPPGPQTAQPLATAPAPLADFGPIVQAALTAALPAWLRANNDRLLPLTRSPAAVGIELAIAPDGSARGEWLAVPSSVNALDDLARELAIETEPFSSPDPQLLPSGRPLACLVRLAFGQNKKAPTVEVAAACLPPDKAFAPVAGVTPDMAKDKDAMAQLFTGWAAEARGEVDPAARAYRKAVHAAPGWEIAARAMGLALVRDKKVPQAIPYLQDYVEARAAAPDAIEYARDIERYERTLAARIAEENRVRERLSKDDIGRGIRKSYPILELCLKAARKARALAIGSDTLTLTWTIRKDGTTTAARLEGPTALLMTEHADCIERAIASWRFPRYSAGSEIAVNRVPLKVRGSSAAPTASASPAESANTAPDDEPMFSICERDPDEIQDYLRSRHGRVQACILAERQRAPKVPLPDSLPLSFVIDSSGPVRSAAVEHRAYREGALAQCVAAALSGSLPPAKGADCPAEFNVDLRALQPSRR
jgi:hypothetical protein